MSENPPPEDEAPAAPPPPEQPTSADPDVPPAQPAWSPQPESWRPPAPPPAAWQPPQGVPYQGPPPPQGPPYPGPPPQGMPPHGLPQQAMPYQGPPPPGWQQQGAYQQQPYGPGWNRTRADAGAPSQSMAMLALIGVAITVFASEFSASTYSVALPSIQRDLHADFSRLDDISTFFMVATPLFLIGGGRLADLIGRRIVFAVGAGVFSLGLIVPSFVPSIELLAVVRLLQAAGTGLMLSAAIGGLADMFPGRRFLYALGAFTAAYALGDGIGGFLAGQIIQNASWRLALMSPVPFLLIGAVLATVGIRNSKRQGEPKRVLDLVSVPPLAFSALFFGAWLSQITDGHWATPASVLFLVLALLAGVAGLVTGSVIKPVTLTPRLVGSSVAVIAAVGAVFGVFEIALINYEVTGGASPVSVGVRMIVFGVGIVFGGIAGTAGVAFLDTRAVLAAGSLLGGVAAVVLAVLHGHVQASVLMTFLVAGVALGLVLTGGLMAVLANVPRGLPAFGGGVYQTGLALGIMIGGVLQSRLIDTGSAPGLSFDWGLLVAVGLLLGIVGAGLAVFAGPAREPAPAQ